MKKFLLFTSILSISSSGQIYSGNILSMFKSKPQTPIEKISEELKNYLSKINVESCKTKAELGEHVQSVCNRDMRDEGKFPLVHAFISQDGIEDYKNIGQRKFFLDTINEVAQEFVENKSAELNLQ